MAVSTTSDRRAPRWTRLATGLAAGVLAVGALAGCSDDAGAPADGGTPAGYPSMMPNPNGDGSMVPCEGSVCTNPNHGAGSDPAENGGAVMENPNGDGSDVPCEGTVCTNPNHGAGE